jgi:septum formation protein
VTGGPPGTRPCPTRLVLASASPRRRDLLAQLGVPFAPAPSHIPEHHPDGPLDAAVAAVALAKARATARLLADRGRRPRDLPGPPVAVLGADTEVVLDGRLMGKPRDAAHAKRMLRALRGRGHDVITGVALVIVPDDEPAPAADLWREEVASVLTRVLMAPCSDEDIDRYVATGEPMDKAGGYAVQGLGARLVERVDGCFTNVIGLPIETTRRMLQRAGVI